MIKAYGGIFWITNYYDLSVQFYQQLDDRIKGTTRNADLLMGIGETVGCGERHADDKTLLKAIKRHEVNPFDYKWYVELNKQFPMQPAGFGMGIEIFLMCLLKCNDIRNMEICLRHNGEDIYQ